MYTGSNIVTDGLVFGYDSYYGGIQGAPTRFYKGQPTTNVLSNPQINGRFTTSNTWASYNTNQYNGNSDFDIGTIGSVSNNIVTLSSVGHVIRSFDVLNPATTGGGVTAGTNYVVKKISSTTFSLHAYNSSQNGSQGYINPSTNFYKVHDAYANDTRVSINATNFPDMWHGSPHLPNSGLIKEIVPNGGYVEGTNCMRLHVYRGDAVADGMSYGVNTPVTQGNVVTVSYWVKPTNANAYGKTFNYQTYFGAGNANSSFNTTLNSTGDWQHVVHQWTASATASFISYWFPSGSTDKYAFDIADVQVELNKGHATPFVAGTRSATDSLIDLKRNNNIDMSYMSFDSTSQPTFDGTDDYILTPFTRGTLGDQLTMIAYYKFDGSTSRTYTPIFGGKESGAGTEFFIGKNSGNTNIGVQDGNYTGSFVQGSNAWDGNYHQIVYTYENGSGKIYLDGVLKNAGTFTKCNAAEQITVGSEVEGSGYYMIGDIPRVCVFDRVLTADEVLKDFNANKNRFNI